jgi:hypothetical protein
MPTEIKPPDEEPRLSPSGAPWSGFALICAFSIVGLLAAVVLAMSTHQFVPPNIAAMPIVP